ncbi:MAG: serine hydrolase domain-containing protein [Gemmatimonadaceae bacterium]
MPTIAARPLRIRRTAWRAAALLVFGASPVALQAQSARTEPSASLRFSRDRLTRIDRFLQERVDSNRIGGAVALVLRDGRVAYQKAVGWGDRESRRAMSQDAIFRIASQSKAITSTAILMLVEEGRITLGDPVSQFIPAYAHTTVASRADSGRTTVPARRQITIKDLLTHSSGISYGTDAIIAQLYASKALGPAAGRGWYTADKSEPICETMERLATLPFIAQPGESYVYGYNTDILGCVVERASGLSLDEFIRTRITVPLGMRDTHFFLPESKRARLVTVYATDSAGRVARAPNGPLGQGDYVDGPRRNYSGGAGLLSTAHDYARFLQMILNRGELDGVRILSPKMVDVMTSNQLGTLFPQPGRGFGLGFETVDRQGADGLKSVGSFGWGGAYGSTYFVDPVERLVVVFMLNQMPLRSDMAPKFPTLVYQALVESSPRADRRARAEAR